MNILIYLQTATASSVEMEPTRRGGRFCGNANNRSCKNTSYSPEISQVAEYKYYMNVILNQMLDNDFGAIWQAAIS